MMIELDRQFYEEQVAPMIRERFPAYEGRIAVGVAGEGSDCFGYDDEISRDHDFGIGVCLWLTEEDAKVIGPGLQEAYRESLEEWLRGRPFSPGSPEALSGRLLTRRGVQPIPQFYYNNLGYRIDPEKPVVTDGIWFYTEEWRFAAAVNGAVFRDDLGQFSRIRELLLGYYPERIRRMRLANALHDYAAAMQANYARCMVRRDPVAASCCRTRSIDAAMNILFLIRRRYAPYYKWKFRAFRELEGSAPLIGLLEEAAVLPPDPAAWEGVVYDARTVNRADRLVVIFEEIAEILAGELRRAGLSHSNEIFLEAHATEVSRGV